MSEPSFEDTFRARFDELFSSLFRYLDRLTGDSALASDIAQETLVRLYQRRSMPDDLRPWLVTVAHNQLRTSQRQARRRQALLALQAAVLPRASDPVPPDRVAEARERGAGVRAALDVLTPRDRDMLLLRSEGYSYREIARILRLGETSVGTLLSRARTAFVRALREDPRASG